MTRPTDTETDRALSTPISHVLAISITTILIIGLLTAGGGYIEEQREFAAARELETIGSRLSAELTRADRLAQETGAVTIRTEHPDTVSGTSYRVRLINGTDCTERSNVPTETCLVLTTNDMDVETAVPIENETLLSIESVGDGRFVLSSTPTGGSGGATTTFTGDSATVSQLSIGVARDVTLARSTEVVDPSNRPPGPQIDFDPSSPTSGQAITFSAAGANDPDGDIVDYTWYVDGTQFGTGKVTTESLDPGTYNVTLNLTDNDGTHAEANRTLRVSGLEYNRDLTANDTDGDGDAESIEFSLRNNLSHPAKITHVSIDPQDDAIGSLDNGGLQKQISFNESFSSAPVVLANVQTTNGEQPVETRVTSTSTDSFNVTICHQNSEDGCESDHDIETVGWVAFETGSGPFDEDSEIGTTGDTVSDSDWTSQSFSTSFSSAPVVVVSTQTQDGPEEAQIDEANDITENDVEVRYCELQSGDTCDGHTTENVGWLAVSDGTLSFGSDVVGEAGTESTSNGQWQTVTFAETYENPVVVGTTNTHNDDSALTFDAKNVGNNSAQVRVCESEGDSSDGCDGHGAETVGYLVVNETALDAESGVEAGTTNLGAGSELTLETSDGNTTYVEDNGAFTVAEGGLLLDLDNSGDDNGGPVIVGKDKNVTINATGFGSDVEGESFDISVRYYGTLASDPESITANATQFQDVPGAPDISDFRLVRVGQDVYVVFNSTAPLRGGNITVDVTGTVAQRNTSDDFDRTFENGLYEYNATVETGADGSFVAELTNATSNSSKTVAVSPQDSITVKSDYVWANAADWGQARTATGVIRNSPSGTVTIDATVASTNTTGVDAFFDVDDGEYTIEAAGADIWTGDDEYGAIYGNTSGDFVANVTVESQEDTHQWAKSGLMAANDMTAGASSAGDVIVVTTPGNGFSMQWDSNGDGYVDTSTTVDSVSYPAKLSLEKSGTTYTGYYSTDGGSTWTEIDSVTIPEAQTSQDIGMAVTSHDAGDRSTVEFSGFDVDPDVMVTSGTLRTDWQSDETLDPSTDRIQLDYNASIDSDESVNVTVLSDTDGDGTAEDESDVVELSDGDNVASVGGLSSTSGRFALEVTLNSSAPTHTPTVHSLRIRNGSGSTLLLEEKFDDGNLGALSPDGSGEAGVDTGDSNSGTYSAYHGAGQGTLTTESVNLSDAQTANISFWIKSGAASGPHQEAPGPDSDNDDLVVEYKTDAGSWVTLTDSEFNGEFEANESVTEYGMTTVEITFPSESEAFHDDFQIRFRQKNGESDNDYWRIDDVRIENTTAS
jgi:hypothetical protein